MEPSMDQIDRQVLTCAEPQLMLFAESCYEGDGEELDEEDPLALPVKTEPTDVVVKAEVVDTENTRAKAFLSSADRKPCEESQKRKAVSSDSASSGSEDGSQKGLLERLLSSDPCKRKKSDSSACVSCSLCNQTFPGREYMNTHLISHVSDAFPLRCPLCNFSFKETPRLANHLLLHSGVHAFGCHLCGESFIDGMELLEHHRRRTSDHQNTCHVCRKTFCQENDLADHIATHVQVDENSYVSQSGSDVSEQDTCEAPDLQLKVSSVFSLSEEMLDDEGDDLLIPSYTEVVMSDEGGTYLSCNLCSEIFMDRSLLTSHLITHTSSVCPHPCPVCDKTFMCRNELEKHLRLHTGLRPYVCHICGNNFIQKCSLQKHVIQTHQLMHTCSLCQHRFPDAKALTLHLKLRHESYYNTRMLNTNE